MTQTLSDTDPQMDAFQVNLLRKKTTSERFTLLCSLTKTAIFHAKRAIARANPELSRREHDVLFVEIHYGSELAVALREFLKGREE